MELRGKTILITGAGRGLGAAMAKRLAARGAGLALVDLDDRGLVAVRDACRVLGARAETYSANVAVASRASRLTHQAHRPTAGTRRPSRVTPAQNRAISAISLTY